MAVFLPVSERKRRRRRRLFYVQSGRCFHCGGLMDHTQIGGVPLADRHDESPTFDHLLPRSKGGDHRPDNVVLACWKCNQARGNQIGWIPAEASA